uniref:Uncharacterized protein n=1 Tax=Panagrolaimus sp. PS1159 TaxID=55785 RepID=A0AC35F5Q0_9BILA
MLLKNNSAHTSKVYQEIRFLVQAMIALAAQMFMCILQLMMFIASTTDNSALNDFAFQNFMWAQNVSNLSVPIALILIGKRIRNDWWNFVLRRPSANISLVKVTTSSTAPNQRKNNNSQQPHKRNKIGTVALFHNVIKQ